MKETNGARRYQDRTGRDPAAELETMRRAVAELIGADPDTWPEHGNAPLAMTAALALALRKEERLEAQAAEAHAFLSRLLTSVAPDCEPLPDLPGLCTQLDNLVAGLRAVSPGREPCCWLVLKAGKPVDAMLRPPFRADMARGEVEHHGHTFVPLYRHRLATPAVEARPEVPAPGGGDA